MASRFIFNGGGIGLTFGSHTKENMYIRRKVFSLLNVEGEDRYFSTTDYIQDGEEVRLFARADYEGLTNKEKDMLRKKRGEFAKNLNQHYRDSMKKIDRIDPKTSDIFSSRGVVRGGGVITEWEQSTHKNGLKPEEFVKEHKRNVTNQMLEGSKDRGKILREQVIEATSGKDLDGTRALSREAKRVISEGNQLRGDLRKSSKDIQRSIDRDKARDAFKKRVEEYKANKAKLVASNEGKQTIKAVEKAVSNEGKQVVKKGLSKAGKVGLGIAGVSAAAGGYALYRHNKNKRNKKK